MSEIDLIALKRVTDEYKNDGLVKAKNNSKFFGF